MVSANSNAKPHTQPRQKLASRVKKPTVKCLLQYLRVDSSKKRDNNETNSEWLLLNSHLFYTFVDYTS